MPSDDELRRVAEDVRALARSLGRDVRAAVDRAREDYGPRDASGPSGSEPGSDGAGQGPGQGHGPGRRSAREDLAAAGRAARQELHYAQMAVRRSARPPHHGDRGDEGEDRRPSLGGPGPGCPPRWDNWGRHRYRGPYGARPGVRPGGRRRSGRPTGPPPPRLAERDRTPAPAPLPLPPLRHRHDGSTLLGLLAVVFGLAWLAAGTRLAHVSPEVVVSIALMVLGAATVVTARTDWALSRRWWPVVGGAALALSLLILSASPGLPVGFRHLEFGSRTITPATWGEVPTDIHGGVGKTTVDLTGIQEPLAGPKTLTMDSAVGRLEIDLPTTLKVLLDVRVSAGQIEVNNVTTSGLGRAHTETLNPSAAGPALTLRVVGGVGSVSITQVPPGGSIPGGPAGAVPTVPLPPKVPPSPLPPKVAR